MTPERWGEVKAVLHRVWELHPHERAAFLDRIHTTDPELCDEVRGLIESDERIGEFLDGSAAGVAGCDEMAGEMTGRRIGPYQTVRVIGHGGMGTVYLAERADGAYRKQVAIKVIRAPLGGPGVLRRFLTERQVAASLDHPSIARLLDGGATDAGLPYLVMEYVEGIRIDEWCDQQKIGVEDRLRLFLQVCGAIEYAHEKRVIHRDIKPGNILVTANGTAKWLDFGVAKVLGGDLAPVETTVGMAPLTPEFASPEQRSGGPVGPESDVYSLGVLLYLLLTGRTPSAVERRDNRQGDGEPETLRPGAATFSHMPPAADGGERLPSGSARSAAAQLHEDLRSIVMKALRFEPEQRYRSAADLAADIGRYLRDRPVRARGDRWIYRARKFVKRHGAVIAAGVAAALLPLVLLVGLNWRRSTIRGADARFPSIAVLPLENLSADRSHDYFADGVTDALIGKLAEVPGLRVISRTSVMPLKGARKPLPEIARSLEVRAVVEGSVVRTGGRMRIVARIVDAAKGYAVWNGVYESEIQDVLRLQDRVAEAIAAEIGFRLVSKEPARSSRSRPLDLDAYDAYLKGRQQYMSEFNKESIQQAIASFQRSLAIDPGFAPSYAGLADCYYMVSNMYYRPVEVMPKARLAALKAIELDGTLGDAHALLALVNSFYDFKPGEAERRFQRAIELKPGSAQAHLWYGLHLASMGRFNEAVAETELARKLDPVSVAMNAYTGAVLYLAHRFDDLVERMQQILVAHPENQQAHAFLALAYEQRRDWPRAVAAMTKACELDQGPQSLAQLGHIYASAGRRNEARRTLNRLREMSRQRYVSAYDIGLLHAGLGERERAFEWLAKAQEDRSEWFAVICADPRLDPFHSDPRFAEVLRAVGR
jgi:serine/threonine protein kinase/TolB-like protein/Flp pilus assembly protein TadD